MTLIKLTHANHRSTVYLVGELVGGWYHSPGNSCTHVVLSGGAVFPALESVDDVTARMTKVSDGPKNAPMMERTQTGMTPGKME